jgi:hypothetical protein
MNSTFSPREMGEGTLAQRVRASRGGFAALLVAGCWFLAELALQPHTPRATQQPGTSNRGAAALRLAGLACFPQ